MDLRQLRFVEAILEAGSVTGAATRLSVTQPAVSQGLRKLESHLGVTLFQREGRRLVPTPLAHRISLAAREVGDVLARLEADLAALEHGTQRVLRIATGCYTCYHWLPLVLREFAERLPGVKVEVVHEATARPFDAILQDQLDVAIVQNESTDLRIRMEKLFTDDLVVVMPPGHPWTERPFVAAEDFRDAIVLVHADYDGSAFVQDVLRPANVAPGRVLELRLTEAVLGGVRAGLGVSVLAQWVVRPEVVAGRLVTRPLTADGVTRRWYAATREREPSVPIREFVDLVKDGELREDSSPTWGMHSR